MKRHIECFSVVMVLLVLFGTQAACQQDGSFTPSRVYIDPDDSTHIEGNISIAVIWGKMIKPPFRDAKSALINLSNAVAEYTDIVTTAHNHLAISSPGLASVAFAVIISEEEFDLTLTERENLKQYLDNGGFLLVDNALRTARESPVEKSFYRMLTSMYKNSVVFKTIPNDHPLYHSYFDFENGPPVIRNGAMINTGPLEGAWIGERLVAVYSNMGMMIAWNETSKNILQLKMGVNMLIFALTQKKTE